MDQFDLATTLDMEAVETERLREVGLPDTRPRVAVLRVLEDGRSRGEQSLRTRRPASSQLAGRRPLIRPTYQVGCSIRSVR